VPKDKPYSLALSYRAGFSKSTVSDGELELINSVLPGLLIAIMAGTEREGGECHGSCAIREGIDRKAG
jgi:hypothetical protein